MADRDVPCLLDAHYAGHGCQLTPGEVAALVSTETPEQLAALLGLDYRGRTKYRDKGLEDACLLLGPADDCSTMAERLRKALAHYEAGQWPHMARGWRPHGMSPLDLALFRVFSSGSSPARSHRRLWDWVLLRVDKVMPDRQ